MSADVMRNHVLGMLSIDTLEGELEREHQYKDKGPMLLMEALESDLCKRFDKHSCYMSLILEIIRSGIEEGDREYIDGYTFEKHCWMTGLDCEELRKQLKEEYHDMPAEIYNYMKSAVANENAEQNKQKIRDEYMAGCPRYVIRKEYGVDKGVLDSILSGLPARSPIQRRHLGTSARVKKDNGVTGLKWAQMRYGKGGDL